MKTRSFKGLSPEGFHRIEYVEWGEENKNDIPILCVHGLTRNSRDYDELANYLSKNGKHVYCPDTVGRGRSDHLKNPRHYTYEQYVRDMAMMIAGIQMHGEHEKVDWIGSSMGGLLGMLVASIDNNPIRRLVMNDFGPFIPLSGIQRLRTYVGVKKEFKNLEDAKLYFQETYSGWGKLTEEQWEKFTKYSVKETSSGKWILRLDTRIKTIPSIDKIILNALLHPLKAITGRLFRDFWDEWRKVKCPVLVIHGKESDILLPETVAKMQTIHPKTDVIEVMDVGHNPSLFDIKQQQMILDWLNQKN